MDMHAYFSRRLGQCRPRTREETREISPEQRSGLYEEVRDSQTDVTEKSAVCNGNLIRPLEPDLIRGRMGGWAMMAVTTNSYPAFPQTVCKRA